MKKGSEEEEEKGKLDEFRKDLVDLEKDMDELEKKPDQDVEIKGDRIESDIGNLSNLKERLKAFKKRRK